MIQRIVCLFSAFLTAGLLAAACGGSPASPQPSPPPVQPPPPPPPAPPSNAAPEIKSIRVQSRRPRTPARFADVNETVDVTATVEDAETAASAMTYEWTATHGTFNGTGAAVTWTGPQSISAPINATLTVKVIERYGHPGQPQDFSHEVTSTVAVRLHDSLDEIGEMAVRFLTEFSKPQTNQDWRDIMRDFKAGVCPHPGDVEAEREDVISHYTNYVMNSYDIGAARVAINFGGSCAFRGKPADACVSVPVAWNSTDKRNNDRDTTSGLDHLTAVYSNSDSRWWLCSSDYEPSETLRHSFYSR